MALVEVANEVLMHATAHTALGEIKRVCMLRSSEASKVTERATRVKGEIK